MRPNHKAMSLSPENASRVSAGNRPVVFQDQDHALLSSIVNTSDDAILSKTLDGIITSWNPAAERMFGYSAEEIIGIPTTILFPPDRLQEEEDILDRLKRGMPTNHFETVRLRQDGTPIHVSVTISPIKDGAGRVAGASTIARDITERKRADEQRQESTERLQVSEERYALAVERLIIANEWQQDAIEQLTLQQEELRAANVRLEDLATTDGLTGLKNHRALHERLQEARAHALRYERPLSVLMLDVDKFKQYNDAFGHVAGDVVLRQVAQILRDTARCCDVVARYGGEEFAILLPEAGVDEARTVAERLRHTIETAVWPERAITVSIGLATMVPVDPQGDRLLADADAALYRSKRRGRNCVTHATDAGEVEALDIEAARWYDAMLQKLLAVQSSASGLTSNLTNDAVLQAYDATIMSWSRILDLKDKETEGHSERVTEMMVRLMQHLNFGETEVRFARWGVWLHDIGKMAVPDHILHKPGPLTEEEWVIMRQHTTVAYEMLQSIPFLGPAIDIPYCHHEKWDGTGYPRALKGDEIPLTARLFAVIDVYDALTSDRPYRRAWPEEQVRAHLRDQSGTHFDERAVDAFLKLLEIGPADV